MQLSLKSTTVFNNLTFVSLSIYINQAPKMKLFFLATNLLFFYLKRGVSHRIMQLHEGKKLKKAKKDILMIR